MGYAAVRRALDTRGKHATTARQHGLKALDGTRTAAPVVACHVQTLMPRG
jgi:hypothetical protein